MKLAKTRKIEAHGRTLGTHAADSYGESRIVKHMGFFPQQKKPTPIHPEGWSGCCLTNW